MHPGALHMQVSVARANLSTTLVDNVGYDIRCGSMALTDAATLGEDWVPEDTFGSRLALVRNRFGWNVKEAAEHCDISHQSWRNWEEGALPRDYIGTCEKISAKVGCSMKWLVGGSRNWKEMTTADLAILPGGAPSQHLVTPQPELPFRAPLRLALS